MKIFNKLKFSKANKIVEIKKPQNIKTTIDEQLSTKNVNNTKINNTNNGNNNPNYNNSSTDNKMQTTATNRDNQLVAKKMLFSNIQPKETFRMQLINGSMNLYYSSKMKSKTTTTTTRFFKPHTINVEEYLEKPPKIFQKATRDTFIYEGSFHEAVGKAEIIRNIFHLLSCLITVFIIAQCFAIMPVKGVTRPHPRYLNFSWSNLRTCWTVLFIIAMLVDTSLTINIILHGPITFNNIEPMIFRLSNILFCVSALSLAKKWPELMLYRYDVELRLPQYTSQMQKRRMADRIHMVTFVGMMLSLAEHLLNQISNIHYSNFCNTAQEPIENFFRLTNAHIFYYFEFSYWLAWYGKLLNVMATFSWNYMDVFVMIISIGLAAKFQQLNDDLLKHKGQEMPVTFWSERRREYRNLCVLCDKIDNAISTITMISFSNNLYFICVQLLKSLNEMPSVAHAAYFYFSLFFLLGRTLAVSLYSSMVHDESRKPLAILRCVPKESWCLEVKRFAEEISSDLVALSGMKFFHLTRKLVLSVAGTIVTYELVLIQFHEATNLWDCEKNNHHEEEQET